MEDGDWEKNSEFDRSGRHEAVELEHLGLVVHPGLWNLRPFVLCDTAVSGHGGERRSRILTCPRNLGEVDAVAK